MRTISADDAALFAAPGGRATYVRVDVDKTGAGSFVNLTTYAGQNMLVSVSWTDSVDGQGQNATIKLKREVELLSLAPLMQTSPLNLGFGFPGTFSALLAPKRVVRIYTADVPTDTRFADVPSASWRLMFEGRIDSIDSASGVDAMTLACSDYQGDLRDRYIEVERVYGYADAGDETLGCPMWQPATFYPTDRNIIPTDANRVGHWFKADSDGVSGSVEPDWSTAIGGSLSEGSMTWDDGGLTSPTTGTPVETILAGLISDNGGNGGGLYNVVTPSSPGWDVTFFLQQRQSLWDALRALVDQIGYDLRFLWDSGSNSFKLTFFAPPRSKTTPDHTFGPGDKWQTTKLVVDVADVRNVIKVVFSDNGNLDPAGNPIRDIQEASDSASIAIFGRRYMEISEASSSNIDTAAEAGVMVAAALSDLSTPVATMEQSIPYFPFVALGDLYRFSPDAVLTSSNLDLAVTGYTHSFDESGVASTVLQCRGKPSGGVDRWLAKGHELNAPDIHQTSLLNTDIVTLTASAVVGGTQLQATANANSPRAVGSGFEFHVSTSPNFTPTSATLQKSGDGSTVSLPHLLPGQNYYAKVVPTGRNDHRPVRAQPSQEIAFTGGQASAGHLVDGVALGDYPLNGGFETRLDTGGMPDHWKVTAGTAGTDFVVMEDNNGLSGGRYMKVISRATLTQMQSAEIPLTNDAADGSTRGTSRYLLTAWVKTAVGNSGANAMFVVAQGVDYQGNLVGPMSSTGVSFVLATSHPGNWQRISAIIENDGATSVRGAYVLVYQNTSGTAGSIYYVDEIRIVPLGSPWYAVGGGGVTDNYQSVPAFGGAWVDEGSGQAPGFRSDRNGNIELAGAVKSGGTGSGNPIWTMPTGWAPPFKKQFTVVDGAGAAQLLVVDTAGKVYLAAGNTAKVSLDGIRWCRF